MRSNIRWENYCKWRAAAGLSESTNPTAEENQITKKPECKVRAAIHGLYEWHLIYLQKTELNRIFQCDMALLLNPNIITDKCFSNEQLMQKDQLEYFLSIFQLFNFMTFSLETTILLCEIFPFKPNWSL